MAENNKFHVAIVGGGLCGLALATALKHRGISFKVYETRSSFTELGAGINVGPNAYTAFQLIDTELGDAFVKIASRNPPGKEDVYLDLRLGKATGGYAEGEVLTSLMAPPTGNMTIGRDALLALLSEMAGLKNGVQTDNASFNKKLVGYEDSVEGGVMLKFEDGSSERASILVACDGIHSAVRRIMLGDQDPSAKARYSDCGAYRAILPTKELEEILGKERARSSQAIVGPGGYVIYYPTTPTTMVRSKCIKASAEDMY
jgi:salicylate hydroxylase